MAIMTIITELRAAGEIILDEDLMRTSPLIILPILGWEKTLREPAPVHFRRMLSTSRSEAI